MRVGIVGLCNVKGGTGIGRVVEHLGRELADSAEVVGGELTASHLPVLRNVPTGFRFEQPVDAIIVPQLTGAAAARGAAPIPVLVTIHDLGIVDCSEDRRAANLISRTLIRRYLSGLNHAARLMCVSSFTASRLLHYYPALESKVRVARPAASFSPAVLQMSVSEARIQLLPIVNLTGRTVILYVGSEHPRKRLGTMLRGFVDLAKALPGALLVKVGTAGKGEWRQETLRTATSPGLRIGVDVVILDLVDDPTLHLLYRSADVYVSASAYEGFGLPLLEAMAAGTPVVATKTASHPEVLGNAGILVDSDGRFLARGILDALDNREGLGRRCRDRAAEFSWTSFGAAYVRELELVIPRS